MPEEVQLAGREVEHPNTGSFAGKETAFFFFAKSRWCRVVLWLPVVMGFRRRTGPRLPNFEARECKGSLNQFQLREIFFFHERLELIEWNAMAKSDWSWAGATVHVPTRQGSACHVWHTCHRCVITVLGLLSLLKITLLLGSSHLLPSKRPYPTSRKMYLKCRWTHSQL